MKKIKIAFLSLLATCTIASCDFLEKEPYKIVPENYFQNEAEAQSVMRRLPTSGSICITASSVPICFWNR